MAPPLREHHLARGKWAYRADAFLERAWLKGWLRPPSLDHEHIWKVAKQSFGRDPKLAERGGRSDEDVEDFRERLAVLGNEIVDAADLNSLGRTMAFGQLVRAAKNRLALGAAWLKQPELLETELADPIVIVGHMRSGTTRIHKLLAADPAHSHTRYCDAYHPVPGRTVDLREWKSAFEIGFLGFLNPWMQSIHPVASTAVEEELGWLAGALQHSIYESQWHIPDYTSWSEARSAAPIYREFARILRTDAAYRGNADRPRVLKVPVFSENLTDLLAQFPTARLVIAERDHEAVHRSAVSLVSNQMAVQSDHCDLSRIEAEWHRKIELREERVRSALANWSGPIARLQFDALNADWESEIRRAYNELGIELTSDALTAMRTLMRGSETGHHRAHSEQLQRFSKQS